MLMGFKNYVQFMHKMLSGRRLLRLTLWWNAQVGLDKLMEDSQTFT